MSARVFGFVPGGYRRPRGPKREVNVAGVVGERCVDIGLPGSLPLIAI